MLISCYFFTRYYTYIINIKLNIKQSIKLASTLINWKEEIINIIKYKINNGYVEGYNNKIKVIKRVSFGLRNYERFRKLIYLRI